MPSSEETQKLSKDVRLMEKLRQPENKFNALRLLQLLTVQEVYSAKERVSSIESEFRKLQEANVAGGARDEGIEERLEELRKDMDVFRLLLSEVDTTTENIKTDLETVRGKVHDEFFRQKVEDTRFNKDIKVLNKEIDHHHAKISLVEKSIEDVRSKVTGCHEIAKLSDKLARVESLVTTMQAKLDSGSTLASDQKKALAETLEEQARVRQYFNAFTPKQEKFVEFLDKFIEARAIPSESFPQTMVDEGPEPPAKASQLMDQYNHFKTSYRLKRPRSEPRFIRAYLKKIDPVSSWYIQRMLLEANPDLVSVLENKETSNKTDVVIFINLDKLSWDHVKTTMHHMDTNKLFSLLESEHVELDIPKPPRIPPRTFNLRPKRRRPDYKY
ncbi:hypothetical protein F4818DRAFT_437302 [Hypoxylon cercidicola]|nr:hypothetical protein F4818DRAFT_437302 [Hypoxylon cercidicola]